MLRRLINCRVIITVLDKSARWSLALIANTSKGLTCSSTVHIDNMLGQKVRELTGQQLLEDIIRERRMRWCGHVWTVEDDIWHSCKGGDLLVSHWPQLVTRGREDVHASTGYRQYSKTSTEEDSNGRIYLKWLLTECTWSNWWQLWGTIVFTRHTMVEWLPKHSDHGHVIA